MGKMARRIVVAALAVGLLLILWREPILFVLGLPGFAADVGDWRDKWLPAVTLDHAIFAIILVNLCFLTFLFFDEKIFRILTDYATFTNPDRVTRTPRYIRLKHRYDADSGYLSPIARINGGERELDRLCDQAEKGDVEAYYLASYLFDELMRNARKYGSSAPHWADMIDGHIKRMEQLHNFYRDRLRQR